MSDDKPVPPRVLPFRRPEPGEAPPVAVAPVGASGNVPNPPAVGAPAVIGPAQLLDVVRQYLGLVGPLTVYIEQTCALAEQLRAGHRPSASDLELIIANAANDRARLELIRQAYEQLATLLEARTQ